MKISFTSNLLFAGCMISCAVANAQQTTPKNLKFNKPLSGVHVKKASKTIVANNQITSGNVAYVSGEIIVLEQGFYVAPGATFTATIEKDKTVESSNSEFNGLNNLSNIDAEGNIAIKVFPNPFRDNTEIAYTVLDDSKVSLSVYNNSGIEVARIIDNQAQSIGKHTAEFKSSQLPAGMYTCVLKTGSERKVYKILKQ